jgi:endogenous inhibitor of DNA gyrase (YacG/DUF329 family)
MNAVDRKTPGASCPLCGKPVELAFKPFCSKRCADIDLNRWLSGVYAIPTKEDEDEDGERVRDNDADEKS